MRGFLLYILKFGLPKFSIYSEALLYILKSWSAGNMLGLDGALVYH